MTRSVIVAALVLQACPAQATETVALEIGGIQWVVPNAWPEQLSFGCGGLCPQAEVELVSGADKITIPRTGEPMHFGEHTDFDERLKVFFRNNPPIDSARATLTIPLGQLSTHAYTITRLAVPTVDWGDWEVTGAQFTLDMMRVEGPPGTRVQGTLRIFATTVPEPAAWLLVLCGLPLLRRCR